MSFAESPLGRDLIAKLARFVQWEKPLRTYRGQNMQKVTAGRMTWESFDRGLRELEASLRAKFDPRTELHPLLERLCTAYLEGDDDERTAIREFAAQRKALGERLWHYANAIAQRIQRADDGPRLAQALAALSIENCQSDYRDALMSLADLFVAAETAGFDPQPVFEAVAGKSTDEPTRGGCQSLAAMLRDFQYNSVLRERRGMSHPYGGPD
jgi:hypothetical protein